MELTFTEHLRSARHCSNCLLCIYSLHPQDHAVRNNNCAWEAGTGPQKLDQASVPFSWVAEMWRGGSTLRFLPSQLSHSTCCSFLLMCVPCRSPVTAAPVIFLFSKHPSAYLLARYPGQRRYWIPVFWPLGSLACMFSPLGEEGSSPGKGRPQAAACLVTSAEGLAKEHDNSDDNLGTFHKLKLSFLEQKCNSFSYLLKRNFILDTKENEM